MGFCDRGVDESIPVIEHGATDAHNDVKEAVSRALRHVGKRNNTTSKAAPEMEKGIGQRDSRGAHWIASREAASSVSESLTLS